MAIDLPLIWALIIAFAVLAYVVLDGFDLGVGILFGLFKDKKAKDLAMKTIAPFWDGNETWLVLGGGGLFAVFPLAYAILMPALYAPVIVMLIGLILRGVAFEFIWTANRALFVWNILFCAGSLTAAVAQGVMLGAIIQGIEVDNRAYAGGPWDWLSLFSMVTGLAVVIGYALLGACWLIFKTEGTFQAQCYRYAGILVWPMLAAIAVVSIWMPFLSDVFLARWFAWPAILYLVPVPVLIALAVFRLLAALRKGHELEPFIMTLAVFVLCYIGLGISRYPHIVPPGITIWDASSGDKSLGFLLTGSLVLIPMVLAYTGYSYWLFRGKVTEKGNYH